MVGQGLHYKALDCGLDGPLKGEGAKSARTGEAAPSCTAEMKGGLGLLDLSTLSYFFFILSVSPLLSFSATKGKIMLD